MRISDWSSDVCSSDLAPDASELTAQYTPFRTRWSIDAGHASPALGGHGSITSRSRCVMRLMPMLNFYIPVTALARGPWMERDDILTTASRSLPHYVNC